MSKKTLINLILALAILVTMVGTASAAPPAQEEMTYTVKLGDNLWTLAEKYLGSGPAYWAIVGATNTKHGEDSTFAHIENPNLIHPGWKLLIPSAEEAEKYVTIAKAKPVTLRVGQTNIMDTINPHAFWYGWTIRWLWYETPVAQKEDEGWVPGLAESWKVSEFAELVLRFSPWQLPSSSISFSSESYRATRFSSSSTAGCQEKQKIKSAPPLAWTKRSGWTLRL